MASREQFRKIALYCDEYRPKVNDRQMLTSSYEDKYENCTNCKHYSDSKCKLDLIDKVLSSMSMEQNFKS
mgnify:CR=1 FL=1